MNLQQITNNKKLTKEILFLFSSLYKGNLVDSSNFILNFINNLQMNNKINKNDPYHFLFNLLSDIHLENNFKRNPNYDINKLKGNKNNKILMRQIFDEFLYNTENSIISNNFYIRLAHTFDCSCSKTYYDNCTYIIKFEIEKYKKYRDEFYKNRIGCNINMEECFNCYCGGQVNQCDSCGNFKRKEYISIYSSSNVLIIALWREKHVFKCDFDFSFQISLNDFYEIGRYMNNNFYILKSCVSLNNQGNYFSFVNINNNWWRFCANSAVYIGNIMQEIYQYEPQLLIYELKNC